MFRDRKKSRLRTVLLLIGVVFVAAFILGYYLNSGTRVIDNDLSKTTKNFEIPESLKSTNKFNQKEGFVSADKEVERIKEFTVLDYITYFKMCGHSLEKSIAAPQALIGLDKQELEEKIDGWNINEMTEERVVFTREIETFCPRHFIISTKDDYIAIYIYNENGEKILKEKTDIDIGILTPEDQMLLHGGIIADTEDDMERKIEGFSN